MKGITRHRLPVTEQISLATESTALGAPWGTVNSTVAATRSPAERGKAEDGQITKLDVGNQRRTVCQLLFDNKKA